MIFPQSLSEAGSYLYAKDTCIFYQHEDVKKIENVLNKSFSKRRGLREINIYFGLFQ